MPANSQSHLTPREALSVVTVTIRVLHQILLMTLLRWVEGLCVPNLCHDFWILVRLDLTLINQSLHLTDYFVRNFLLFFIMAKDDGCILRTLIILLPVHRCRIMKNEQVPNKLLV